MTYDRGTLAALKDANDRAETAEAQRDALVKALEFYANPEVYKPHPHGLAFDTRDLSDLARRTLATLSDEQRPGQE